MSKPRPVIVCTEHRGVFYGKTTKSTDAILRDRIVELTDARMAIYWGTYRGVMQLARTGPTSKSKIGDPADIGINAVTSVFEVSDEAESKWSNC